MSDKNMRTVDGDLTEREYGEPFDTSQEPDDPDLGALTNAEFRERIARICGARPEQPKPCVRNESDAGYKPPTRKNKTQ